MPATENVDQEIAELGDNTQEVNPEQIDSPDNPPTYGENNRELPEQLQEAISNAAKMLQGKREIYDRRIEVLQDRMRRFYDEGIQHVYPNYGTGTFQVGQANAYVDLGNRQIQCPEYIGAYNIFRANGRSIDAVLTQNPPGVDFRADDPSRAEDIESAETKEGYRHLFDKANDIKEIQQKVSRMFRLSGRTVIWTRTVADKQRWGLNEQGEPRKMETAIVYGTLESKCPIICREQSAMSYCFLYDDPDVIMAKADYPWIRSKIHGGEGGVGESDWERFARLGVQQARKGYFLTGNALAHITTRVNCFLRPAVFQGSAYDDAFLEAEESDQNEDGSPFTVGDKLNQLFPDGCHAVFVGQTYAESWNESMDDALVIGFPYQQDGMSGSTNAIMEPMVVIQDVFNDYKNAERQNYEKGWPSLWVDADDVEYDAIMDQRAEPCAIRLKKNPSIDQPLANSFYREPDMELPESFVDAMAEAQSLGQVVTGALPALQGAPGKGEKTATQTITDRSQAMGQLGMPWANVQRIFARMYDQAALLATKNPDHSKEIVVASGDGPNVTIRLENITKGKSRAYPDTDSSFPESTAAKRAQLQQIVVMAAQSPIGQTFFQSPDNWEEIAELQGFPELKLIPAIAYKKQVREFELLLREAPVPPSPQELQAAQMAHATATVAATVMGGPPPPPFDSSSLLKSSVPVMPEDYHQWEYAKCQEWLSDEECWREQAEGNLQGIQNVRLHAQEHKAQMIAQMPPPMPPPPPAPHHAPPPAHGGPPGLPKAAAPPGAPGAPTL